MAPVHNAAGRNDVEALGRLLDEEPELLEARDPETPLCCAVRANAIAAARLLINRGADVNVRAEHGMTPLMMACIDGLVEMASLVLDRGADPLACTGTGMTALTYTLSATKLDPSCYVEVLRLLIKDGRVPINARDERGMTALWRVCWCGYMERARVLLVEGRADHTIPDEEGETAMAAARRRGQEACVQLLEWYEGELERAFLLSKARAVVDATESNSKAPEKVEAKTRGKAQRAREEAAPVWLRGRVERGEALPSVEVAARQRRRGRRGKDEEERRAVLGYAVRDMPEDLYVEMMEGLRLR